LASETVIYPETINMNNIPKTQDLSGQEVYQKICDNIQKVIKGQSGAIRKLLSAFARNN
jgi:MoxR-like ATPase